IEFLTATLTGDDSIIPEDTRMTFTSSGLAHILALSGLHVGIITTMLWIVLFPLRLVRQLHLRLIYTVIILWLYAIITGLSPSVVRAVIMATTMLFGFCLQRRNSSINSLCLATIIILIVSPLQLYDIGFQLSVIAVASILLFSHRLNPIKPKHKKLHFVVSTIIVSPVATLGTGMVAAYYFHSFPTYFLIANIVVLAILPLTMISGMILIIISATCSGINTEWLCIFIDWTYSLILDYSEWVNALPYSSIKGIYFSPWILLPYFITLATLLWAIVKRKTIHWLIFIIGVVLTVAAFLLTQKTYADSEFFIARESRHTNIICRYDKHAFLITTAQPQMAQTALADANRRHRDFLAMRGVDTLKLVSDSFSYNSLKCQQHMLSIGKKRLILITDEKDLDSISMKSPNYIIVCRGFKGNVVNLRRHNPDTIVLSGDLHIRRHDRYLDSLVKYSIPHISLRNDEIIHILNP
ncbi:MAG: ComEC/Rec2 family competence protein, partial [Muribaculaceae bacterium]|nr:ComEC/Rec2 family competence protein [Muribaculaceae bacterium]